MYIYIYTHTALMADARPRTCTTPRYPSIIITFMIINSISCYIIINIIMIMIMIMCIINISMFISYVYYYIYYFYSGHLPLHDTLQLSRRGQAGAPHPKICVCIYNIYIYIYICIRVYGCIDIHTYIYIYIYVSTEWTSKGAAPTD